MTRPPLLLARAEIDAAETASHPTELAAVEPGRLRATYSSFFELVK
jgi:hypothetical protein